MHPFKLVYIQTLLTVMRMEILRMQTENKGIVKEKGKKQTKMMKSQNKCMEGKDKFTR